MISLLQAQLPAFEVTAGDQTGVLTGDYCFNPI